MKTSKTIRMTGIGILFLVWLWLAWGFLSSKGVTLLNLIILAMTGIIIFLPLYKRYILGLQSDSKKDRKDD
ncbi:MAG: hypothetical protein K2G23_00070 [Muribaculaceae bacterium]|nr:hypothetical protein [Muribaculaceae bacterium]